jgi:hypothetical protein
LVKLSAHVYRKYIFIITSLKKNYSSRDTISLMQFLLIGSPDQPAVVSRDQSQLPTSYTLIWRQAVHVHVLKKGSPYLYWRQAAMSILEAGSPVHVLKKRQSSSVLKAGCHVHSGGRQSSPCFEKKAVLICTEGRQPCPFWRQAVHVFRQAVHVHVLEKRQSLCILEAGSYALSGCRQSMSSGFRQFMSTF